MVSISLSALWCHLCPWTQLVRLRQGMHIAIPEPLLISYVAKQTLIALAFFSWKWELVFNANPLNHTRCWKVLRIQHGSCSQTSPKSTHYHFKSISVPCHSSQSLSLSLGWKVWKLNRTSDRAHILLEPSRVNLTLYPTNKENDIMKCFHYKEQLL